MQWQKTTLSGWGRATHADVYACEPRTSDVVREALTDNVPRGLIAYGGGRSYSDGHAILTTGLTGIIGFDQDNGEIVCGAGVTFHDLLRRFLSEGWLAPVSPGTGFVTIGGAIANDVHGKNHEHDGSFGDHVLWFDLLLPNGEIRRVTREHQPELFAATIGGIGLTGIIISACFRMKKVPSNSVELQEQRIEDLDGYFEAFEAIRTRATYSVGWIDTLAGPDRQVAGGSARYPGNRRVVFHSGAGGVAPALAGAMRISRICT